MPGRSSFEYAVIRIVPRVDREEFINAGVVLYCKDRKWLEARVTLDETRLRALWPDIDLTDVRPHLEALPRVAAGDPEAGPVAQLSQGERFRWLVSPRSTVVQVSPAHAGLCDDPEQALERLFRSLVAG